MGRGWLSQEQGQCLGHGAGKPGLEPGPFLPGLQTPSSEAEKQTFPPPEHCPCISATTRLHARSKRTEVTQWLVSATS